MKSIVYIISILLLISFISCSKKMVPAATELAISTQAILEDLSAFQLKLNEDYKDTKTSPMSEEQIKLFIANEGHDFFDIDLKYRVVADFERATEIEEIKFETTTDRVAVYDLYGIASFDLDGKACKMNIYQSHYSREIEEYKDYLFLPFNDLTNSVETYGGGRYVDLRIPDGVGDKIIIDFNKSYNPYCAYSTLYSCPIPPVANRLDLEIMAGVQHVKNY